MAENKVRVTKLFGGGGAMGAIDPKVNMVTNQGTIIDIHDSGRMVVACSGNGVGTLKDHYADDLFVLHAHATGVWSYPTGDGSVVFGRSVTWANGVPDAAETGILYLPQNGLPEIVTR